MRWVAPLVDWPVRPSGSAPPTFLRVDYAKRRFGPYVGFDYGNYYAPDYVYSYVSPYWNYYQPLYPSYYGYSSTCYRSRRCSRPL